jgi:hypothetical protein
MAGATFMAILRRIEGLERRIEYIQSRLDAIDLDVANLTESVESEDESTRELGTVCGFDCDFTTDPELDET